VAGKQQGQGEYVDEKGQRIIDVWYKGKRTRRSDSKLAMLSELTKLGRPSDV